MASETLDKVLGGLKILQKHAARFNVEPIPQSFPNGAPAFSYSAYIAVEIDGDLAEDELAILKELGWHDEWPAFTFYGA